MQEATAQESGLVAEGKIFPTPMAVGDSFAISGTPRYETNKDGIEFVILPCLDGIERSTSSASIVGSCRSTTPKSMGDLISQSLAKNKALRVWVIEKEANTHRMGMAFSIYEPARKSKSRR